MKMMRKLLILLTSALAVVPLAALADWYEATGNPAARSTISSAVFRTEFAAIETNISDKLPTYTGNADQIVVVNSTGTGLTVAAAGIAVAVGGTGATTAAGARTNLGLAIGTNVQAWDADLDAIAALAKTDSNFIVGNGSTWVLEDAATTRTSLGLGSIALLSAIDDDNWDTTDLAIANGGTGASTAAAAATALGLGTGDSPQLTGINLGHASDSTLTRAAAGEIELEGRPMIVHDSGTYVGGRLIVTGTTPTDTTGMDSGDIKLVY